MRVFDERYGYGTIIKENSFHVIVQFDCEPDYAREYIKFKGEDNKLHR